MQAKTNTTILVTGGHLTPALATLEALKKRGYSSFVWFGRKKTMRKDTQPSTEYQLVTKEHAIPFVNVITGKIIRFSDISSFFLFFFNLIKIPIGLVYSFLMLIKHRPNVIVSFGGYVALPVVIAGWVLRIPSVTHEQTTVVGLANNVISKFARIILVSWENTRKFFNKNKTVYVGNPIRKEVLQATTQLFTINEELPTLYITGGNQGAHVINSALEPIIPTLLKKYNVIHQTGTTTVTRDFEKFKKFEKSLIGKTTGRYVVRGSIFGAEIGEVFAKANVVVSRSGANTITELLALGKISILIPIPWSIHNEQLKNAEMLKKIGLAKIIHQKELTNTLLLESINTAFTKVQKEKTFSNTPLCRAQEIAREKVRLDAAERIVDEIEKLVYPVNEK